MQKKILARAILFMKSRFGMVRTDCVFDAWIGGATGPWRSAQLKGSSWSKQEGWLTLRTCFLGLEGRARDMDGPEPRRGEVARIGAAIPVVNDREMC